MQNQALREKQIVTQFELSNLIRKSKIFSKIKLAPATRLVLESLVYHYPNIRVNIKTLEEETGNSRRSVDNALNELKEKGLILITHTGRSNIFTLTQTFFDLLEVAPQVCRKEDVRHAKIALPHNKHEKKEDNKTFQDKVLKFPNKIPGYLKDIEHAKAVLMSYNRFNLNQRAIDVIKQIQEHWNFDTRDYDLLIYLQEIE